MRSFLLPAALLLACLSPPTALACCHLYGDEGAVGPCAYAWRGDLVFTGEQRLDEAHVSCTAGGASVGASWVPCTGVVERWHACLLP